MFYENPDWKKIGLNFPDKKSGFKNSGLKSGSTESGLKKKIKKSGLKNLGLKKMSPKKLSDKYRLSLISDLHNFSSKRVLKYKF